MSHPYFRYFQFVFLTLILLPGLTFAGTLSNQIATLENPPPKTRDEAAVLIHHYLFAREYKKAAELSRSMYGLTKEWGHLFNEALARTAVRDSYGERVWKSYLELSDKEQGGPKWRGMAEKIRDTLISGQVQNEEDFIRWIRECYYGRGYYTAWVLTDIYEKYDGKKDLDFLREMRGDMLFRSGFTEEAIALYQRLYTERGDEYFLYQQARCYLKLNNSLAARGLLLSIKDDSKKNFNYYYTLARAGLALNMENEVKTYMSEARNRAQSGREMKLLEDLTKI